jgi:predicted ATP-grasp superfamily ATP-dependent carboligase
MPETNGKFLFANPGVSSDSAGSFSLPRAESPTIASPAQLGEAPEAVSDGGRREGAPVRGPSGPPRVLMVATVFNMPYRVLRCAQASGAEVYVLGNPGANWLRFSRYCRRFVYAASIIHGGRDEALALEINCLVRELGIAMVMPGDAPSTRAVIACRDLIEAPCFPLPSLNQFDLLNDKWAFAQLCQKLGIRHPATRILPEAASLAREIATGRLEYPLVAKPLSRSGNGGVVFLDGTDTEKQLNTINYQPVLVQTMIPGQDIGASVFAKAGKIEAFVAHSLRQRVYATFRDDQIYSDIAKIVAWLHLEGVYNFDMILGPDGSVFYLECNPRFYFKINLSMLAGINFVGWGLPGAKPGAGYIPDGVRVRFPEAALTSFDLRCAKRDWAMAAYIFSDLAPYLAENLNLTV